MADTIELLEAIGRDASLRHAPTETLVDMLAQAQASEAFTAAVTSGDSSPLADELGHKQMYTPQISQSPGHEDDDCEDAEEGADEVEPSPQDSDELSSPQ